MTFTHAGYDDVHRGRHVCLPFETDSEKLDAAASFVIEGLTSGKRCLFVGRPEEMTELAGALESRGGLCASRARARGRLLFATPQEAYKKDGVFDPQLVLDRLERHVRDAIADGFTGLYATGELVYEPADEDWRRIVWYEAQMNETFARLPLAALCRYPRSVVPAARVRDILRTHPVAMVRGESCRNPFYERTQLALSDDSQARLDWQLRQLRVQNRTERRLEAQTYSAVAAAAQLANQVAALQAKLGSGD
jgi:hypothetical protein